MAIYEFPASFGQRRMWLLDQIDPGRPTYDIGWAIWLDGPLDTAALQVAWDAAFDRHEALRTTFRNEAGTPVQVIDDESQPQPLSLVSLEHLPEEERGDAARQMLRELARTAFDLVTGPLVRTCLIRLSSSSHVFGVVVHHIVADGWSFRILFDEISADYQAVSASRPPVSVEPPIQYADFALWQIENADEGGYAAAERFWRAELADAAPALPLPTDHPYQSGQTFAAAGIDLTIDDAVATALRELATRRGTTLFAVLLASYAALLSRMTGSRDLLVAVPMAARTRLETESVVGLCMNTVTVRVSLDGDPTLGQLVEQVHATTGRVLAHQELPFARVVELCRPERDPARSPLVQVMFAMEEPWLVPDRGGLRWRPELVENGTAKFELELTVTDGPTEPRVRLNYNTDLFAIESGQRFADGFEMILGALATDPETRVTDVDILSPRTRDLVTRRWPASPAPVAAAQTATMLLAAACSGDRVVATGSDATLTGAQLHAGADRIAAGLSRLDVGVGDRVAILLPRGARLIPALLGVWWVGAAYVPLDPIYPPQRLRAMLVDAGVRVMITDTSALAAPVPEGIESSIAVLDLATLGGAGDIEPAPGSPAAPPRDVPPTAAAYTIFTSGSTGRPKAVTVTQGALATLLSALRQLLPLRPEDRIVAVSTFAFDIAAVELLLPVLCGASVVVADADEAMDGASLRRLLATSEATALQATPATWRMLVDAGGVPSGVRLRVTGGEPLPRDLADALVAEPGARLWNLYGPTETAIYSAGAPVGPSPAPIELGSIIAGTRVYVLDERMRPVPPGVVGEVYIGGAGVAQGYVGAAGLTAQRFLPDPFSGEKGARLYRTGDLGRWRASGRIELAGRADRQVKVRGFRVETGEIETVLRTHPEVVEAVVTANGTAGHDVRLVAYLVTRSGGIEPPAEIRKHLRQVLPDYMLPSAFVVLTQLPHTTTGKVDYRALPEPQWGLLPGEPKAAASTPLEQELTLIFAELLALAEPVGVRDNFFALGGHSLTATRLMARVFSTYGVDLPVRVLFADPTVEGLAAAIDAAQDLPQSSDRGPVPVAASAPGSRGMLDSFTDSDVDKLLRTLITDERG